LLQELPLPPKSRVHVLRVFPPGQTFAVGQMERSLKQAVEQLLEQSIKADSDLVLGYPAGKTNLVPNLAEKYEVVDGGKGYTGYHPGASF
jgi:hypothetical protein